MVLGFGVEPVSSRCWSHSVGYDLRIVFDFVRSANQPEDAILLLEIGTHDEVY